MKILKQLAIIALVCYGQSALADREEFFNQLSLDMKTVTDSLNMLSLGTDGDTFDRVESTIKTISHKSHELLHASRHNYDLLSAGSKNSFNSRLSVCYNTAMDWTTPDQAGTSLSQHQLNQLKHSCKHLTRTLEHLATRLGITLKRIATTEEYLASEYR